MTVSVRGIRVHFDDKVVLEDFSLEFPECGVVVLFGPSGCGKTTLLDALCGVVPLDSGTIEGMAGKRITRVFQDNRLLPWVDAFTNVRAVVADDETAQRALEITGLAAEADTLPGELSGGMQKRLCLARAYAHNGDIVLLDEPTVGIDETSAFQLMDVLMQTWEDRLVVLVTHDRPMAERYANHIFEVTGLPLQLVHENTRSS